MQPLQRNENIELTIDGFGSEGQGVGRHEGFAVFVPFALPGERIKAHIVKPGKSFAIARLTDIIEKSPLRIDPDCKAFGRCGGCALMHLEYPAQLEYKRLGVENALKRIGGFTDISVKATIGMEKPMRYRNKAAFVFGVSEGKACFGFYAPRSHRLIPLDDCPIQQVSLVDCAKAVEQWANACRIPVYDETTGKGALRHVVARSNKAGEIIVVIVSAGELSHKNELISTLRASIKGLCGIMYNRNDRATNVIFGDHFDLVWGQERLTETICGFSFRVSSASFFQVNPEQTETLYRKVESLLPESGNVSIADIFCGTGTITLLTARKALRVVGIECVADAIADARLNAQNNGITNADFICGDAEVELPVLVKTGFSPDVIIVDPPRKGCDPAVIDAMIQSAARSIIYVSCDPATLARDCKKLCESNYEIKQVQPIDMFPQTPHVETCVLLSHKNS